MWILSLVVGLGAGSWIVIRIITDHPPPEARAKLFAVVAIAAVGSLLGNALFGRLLTAASDPMPIRPVAALVAIVSMGLLFGTMTAIGAGFADKAAR